MVILVRLEIEHHTVPHLIGLTSGLEPSTKHGLGCTSIEYHRCMQGKLQRFFKVNLNTSQILQTPVENYLMVQKVFVLVLLKGSVKKKNVSNVTFSRMVYMKPNHVLDLIFTRLSQVLFAF